MRNTNKKGFTIVELVVVVAVIAILAAVLIPTFSGIINRANESADIHAVRNMNVALASATKTPSRIGEVGKILGDAGFNTEKGLTPAYKDRAFYWFRPTNQIVYVNEADGKFELIFPEKVEGFPTAKNTDCQPIEEGIVNGIINAPNVSDTENIETDLTYWSVNNKPDNTDFESIIEWSNTEHLFTSNTYEGGVKKPGILITGGNIKLTSDLTLGRGSNTEQSFFIVGDTTIDLNGYTLTQEHGTSSSGGYALFLVRSGATLNIIDSSEEKTGTINAVVVVAQLNSNATLNVFGGTLKCDAGAAKGQEDEDRYVVWNYGGTLNMHGGTLDANITNESVTGESWAIMGNTNDPGKNILFAGTLIGDIEDSIENFGATIKE